MTKSDSRFRYSKNALLAERNRSAGKKSEIAGTGDDVDIGTRNLNLLRNHAAIDRDVAHVEIPCFDRGTA